MSEKTIEEGISGVVRTYELMDRVRTRRDLVFRDDQFDYPALVDAARYAGRRRIRLSLLDTGRFSVAEVEALARTGARILTSDEARPRAGEWEILLKACRESRTHLSVFWNGPLPVGDDATAIPLRTIEDLLERGMDLHVSNRTHARDAGTLGGLAAAAKKGRGYFVFYHLGPLVPELAGPACRRAWIHLSDRDALDASWAGLAVAIARAAAASGARAVVHVERGLPLGPLEELWSAGAAIVFLIPPSDRCSLFRPVERKAARLKLPARAFHLSTAFMP